MFTNYMFTVLNEFVLHNFMSINYIIIEYWVPVLYKAMLFNVYYIYLPQDLLVLEKLPSSLQFFLQIDVHGIC